MSDWRLVEDEPNEMQQQAVANQSQQNVTPKSDWRLVEEPQRAMPKEGLGTSAYMAPFRVAEDVYKRLGNIAHNIPLHLLLAQREIPGMGNVLRHHPLHTASQFGAGVAEAGQGLFNTPHNIANYLTERLHLFPEQANKMIQMGRMPEDVETLNATFGAPKYPGDVGWRTVGGNVLQAPTVGAAVLSPHRMLAPVIARAAVRSRGRWINRFNKKYNDLFGKAAKEGITEIPHDRGTMQGIAQYLSKHYHPDKMQSLHNFINEPTAMNAHWAQSDLGALANDLKKQSGKKPLFQGENEVLNAINYARNHLKENMFVIPNGKVNSALKKDYNKITKDYSNKVAPYRYNADISAYMNKKITAKELINALSHGEFARKMWWRHPAMLARKAFLPTVKGGLTLAGIKYLHDQTVGNKQPEPEQK